MWRFWGGFNVNWKFVMAVGLGAIAVLIILEILKINYWFVTDNMNFPINDASTFGDSFGGLTALFSGLAFIGVLLTLHLQRKELEETREVLRDQEGHLKKQARAADLQWFETTFFRLLDLHSKYKESISFSTNFANEPNFYQKRLIKEHSKNLQLYFKTVTKLIDFIGKQSPDKQLHFSIFISQLLNEEMAVLASFSKSPDGKNISILNDYVKLEYTPEGLEQFLID